MSTLEERVRLCEHENARLRRQLSWQNRLWLVAALLAAGSTAIAGISVKEALFDSVRTREITVVDAKGIVRARLGGDLPDAVMANGHVAKRGSKAAGLIIYDEEGIERGGYVTMEEGSNAMLTLDSKFRQAALFVAGPGEGQASALRLWTKGSAIEMRADGSGSRLSISDPGGVTTQQPAVQLSPDACIEYKKLEVQYPGKHTCQSRFTDSACHACLTGPETGLR